MLALIDLGSRIRRREQVPHWLFGMLACFFSMCKVYVYSTIPSECAYHFRNHLECCGEREVRNYLLIDVPPIDSSLGNLFINAKKAKDSTSRDFCPIKANEKKEWRSEKNVRTSCVSRLFLSRSHSFDLFIFTSLRE